MGQIVQKASNPVRCNLVAIQAGGSQANVVLDDGEVWFVDTTNAEKGTDGYGHYDAYIVGDGTKKASALVVTPIDDMSAFATKQELATKQDTINDLATIRSGAQKGNTAYQKPNSGIPKSDLASAVQISLDNVATNTANISALQAAYEGLTQSDIIVGALPASGVANTIYRAPGTSSYSDYMWDGSQFVLMATYDNAIDDVPTTGSENLVTSGGVKGAIDDVKSITPSIFDDDSSADLNVTDQNGNVIFQLGGGHLKTKNFDSNGSVPTISEDNSEADLNVTDSNGHVLAEFKDGQFKTKNFDSRSISNIFADKNIICLGDSITWYGGDDCTGERGWTTWFKEKAKPASIRSFARSGATLTSLSDSVEDIEDYTGIATAKNIAYNQLARVRAAYAGTPSSHDSVLTIVPDIVFLAFGTNDLSRAAAYADTAESMFVDCPYRTSYAQWQVNELLSIAKAMRYMCEQLYVTFPDCQIIVIAPQQQALNEVGNKRNGAGYLALGNLIEQCCDFLSVNCIRMDKHCGTYNIREIAEGHKFPGGDVQHPNALGARENGYFIYNQVKSILKY